MIVSQFEKNSKISNVYGRVLATPIYELGLSRLPVVSARKRKSPNRQRQLGRVGDFMIAQSERQ